MRPVYPLQALMVMAALGLLVGLPSLHRPDGSPRIVSQSSAGACFAPLSNAPGEHKPLDKTDLKAIGDTQVSQTLSNRSDAQDMGLDVNRARNVGHCA